MMLRNLMGNKNRDEAEIIAKSDAFSPEYYRLSAGLNEANNFDLAEHYLEEGEKSGLVPSGIFDPGFYAYANPDVAETGSNLLLHYEQHGRGEGRFPSLEAVKAEAQLILPLLQQIEGGITLVNDMRPLHIQDPLTRYLALWRRGVRLFDWFDDLFYAYFYEDVSNSGFQPFTHYLRFGRIDARITSNSILQKAIRIISYKTDIEYYTSSLREVGFAEQEIAPLKDQDACAVHYLRKGYFVGISPSPNFDPAYYLTCYPDIAAAPVEPLLHFIENGAREGRKGRFDASTFLQEGGQRFDQGKPTILVACHEASRTGAPLVGLNLIIALQPKYNVLAFLCRGGDLLEEFVSPTVAILVGIEVGADSDFCLVDLKQRFKVSRVVLNSIETDRLAKSCVIAGIPTVALVHEFAEYTLPPGRMADLVRRVHEVIVPAKIIEASLQKEVEAICVRRAPHVTIAPQGKLPYLPPREEMNDFTVEHIKCLVAERCPGATKIVLGAGFVSIRKGLEFFVQAAAAMRAIRSDVAFVWVGVGMYPPNANYSLWISEMIVRMGLTERILFLPEQSSLSAPLEVSDVFFLSSRLDPFPNVIIDALEAGRAFVCFDEASGAADLVETGRVDAATVPYGDVVRAAEALGGFLSEEARRDRNTRYVEEALGFGEYLSLILRKLDEADSEQLRRDEIVASLGASAGFRASYYEGRPVRKPLECHSLRDYVAASSRGLARRNPRPGVSECLVAPSAALTTRAGTDTDGKGGQTHHCYILKGQKIPIGTSPRIGIHLHLHFADLAVDFASRFKTLGHLVRFFITVTKEESIRGVADAFPKRHFPSVTIVTVENRGRDVGPFLVDFKLWLNDNPCDVIGHFHGKKSVDLGLGVGAAWRDFLCDTLIGRHGEHVGCILALFADPKLGLVFAEDPHCVGWSDNRQTAENLITRLPVKVVLPPQPVFPLGTMFWARPEALRPFFDARISREDLPLEPLPYDGTMLHAFERVLPSVGEAAGYSWSTVCSELLFR